MIHPVRVSAPAINPVSLSEVKARLKVDHSEDDSTLSAYIEAATRRLDGWDGMLGRCLINQGWKVRIASWPCDRNIHLPFPNCSAVTVNYSTDGASPVAVPSGSVSPILELNAGSAVLIFTDFDMPSLDPERGYIEAVFTAGYGAAGSDVPAPIRQAIHLMVGDMFRFTESAITGNADVVPISTTVENLIAPYRRRRV